MMNEKPRKIETPNCIHIWPVPDMWENTSEESTEE